MADCAAGRGTGSDKGDCVVGRVELSCDVAFELGLRICCAGQGEWDAGCRAFCVRVWGLICGEGIGGLICVSEGATVCGIACDVVGGEGYCAFCRETCCAAVCRLALEEPRGGSFGLRLLAVLRHARRSEGVV